MHQRPPEAGMAAKGKVRRGDPRQNCTNILAAALAAAAQAADIVVAAALAAAALAAALATAAPGRRHPVCVNHVV